MSESEQDGDDTRLEQEKLTDLLRKAEALKAGGKTEGERAAAAAAAARIRAKLLDLKERQAHAAKRKASALARSPTPIQAPAAAPSPWSPPRFNTMPVVGTPPPERNDAQPSPPPRRRRVRPLPSERFQPPRRRSGVVALLGTVIVSILVVLSYVAIAVLAAMLADYILRQRAPDIVRVSEAIVAAALVLALLLVNWSRYWRSTPLRIRAAFYGLALNGQTLVACLAIVGGIALGWASWNYKDNIVIAGLGLFASGMALFLGGGYLVIAIGFSVFVTIFGWGQSTSAPNLDTVRNQNADIDADFADSDEIERALGGAPEDGHPRPYKYND